MIYLYRGQANTVVLTLNEKATNSTHDWLMKLTEEISGQDVIFPITDISTSTERYNKFVITETDSQNIYQARVQLKPTGFWDYVVYEMPVSSPPSLDTSLALETVETGRAFVIDENEIERPTFDTNNEKDNATFNGSD